MKKRIETLLSFVVPKKTFADIGCDHGLIAVGVLKSGICERVIAADVSADSLEKAVKLADNESIEGLIPILSDGFKSIFEHVDEAMIAGMGGEEIIKILAERGDLPERLIMQPMKNAEKLRRFLIFTHRFPITDDFTFFDGDKYYDVIVADRSAPFREYNEDEIVFGKDNLCGREDFVRYARNLCDLYSAALDLSKDALSRETLKRKITVLKKYC